MALRIWSEEVRQVDSGAWGAAGRRVGGGGGAEKGSMVGGRGRGLGEAAGWNGVDERLCFDRVLGGWRFGYRLWVVRVGNGARQCCKGSMGGRESRVY